ncbi:glycine cleavage system H protein [Planctopirus limnophila DSM 3776]|uniref:Glycine cleavage system H protein n=1 Tax=Planctopirus limnophila (strain ATCC 43296 / DSM 3776 / IFAM 1008 / Mu 290) TaxID=521674 RepID=D5SQ43_PLAL2|nr:glycine cleavage system protein GcvH [Planctopirus limnophila]ADG68418.1 glycine cleavage system H protein [Planctopirus limnophila DSM 3776]
MDLAALKYAKTHEWVAIEGDVATVGITDFAVQLLSDLVYIDLPKPGKALKVGESCGEVESVKAVSDVYAPLAGVVTETNPSLGDNTEPLSSDPFGNGWLIKMKVSDLSGLEQLLDRASYEKHCESEAH